ncbi:MAG: DUF6584 family protein [Kordia sp.]|uniref:DUF6584 family protein n=1 Tax=Kordia sp. TaxID=1965332 RepID=UPI00385B542E
MSIYIPKNDKISCYDASKTNILSLKDKLKRINFEIENGLKFKASDRLRNLIQENPNEIQLWNKLAELYYESGFLDAAGKYWILTEPTDERISKCVEIYEKSVNYSGYQILQEIVFRGDKTKLSEFAQHKLSELEADCKAKNHHIPKFNPKVNNSQRKHQKHVKTFKDKLAGFLLLGILLTVIVLIVIGFVSVMKWMF